MYNRGIYDSVMKDDVYALKYYIDKAIKKGYTITDLTLPDYLSVAISNNRIHITKYLIETYSLLPPKMNEKFLSKDMKEVLKN